MFPFSLPVEEKNPSHRSGRSSTRALGRMLLALLLGLVIIGVASSIAMVAAGGPKSPPARIGFLTHTGFLVLSLVVMLVLRKGRLAGFGFQPIQGPFPWSALILALGLGAAATGIEQLVPGSGVNPAAGFSSLQIILLIWIWASLAEEVLMRGLIQSFLDPLQDHGFDLGNVRLSLPVLFAACFFSVMHFGLLSTGTGFLSVLPLLVFALMLGLLAGYFREKTASLLPAILIHMCGNIGGTVVAWTMR